MVIIASNEETFEARFQLMHLIPLMTLSSSKNTDSAASLLIRMAGDPKESVPYRQEVLNCLVSVLLNGDHESVEMLKTNQHISNESTKLLADRKADREVRERAGLVLQACIKPDVALITPLNDLLNSDELFVHQYAAGGLRNIGPRALKAVPRLIDVWLDVREPKEAREAAKDALLENDTELASQLGIRAN